MAVQAGEDVYASLLLTDAYLPGALVLAHSLRDAGTKKKLAILVTLDTVAAEVITQLKAVYDYVIPVPRIRNDKPANLYLMNRPDLHSAFTKINLWKQTQFRKIVYLDADVVAYRAPDELFDLPHDFSAAPDIGWPDIFNTGVMVLRPNMGDYFAMMAMAERGISFDGADQGLLNMHFKHTFNRLSFTYNVTPSAHYQYIPAYRHFQSSINMVHFIGADKPWLQGRDKSTGSSPYDEMVGRWWAVYDKHYRREVGFDAESLTFMAFANYRAQTTAAQQAPPAPELVQYFVKGEYQPVVQFVVPVGEPPRDQGGAFHGQQYQPPALPYSEHQHQQPQLHYHDHQHQPQQHYHHEQSENQHHPHRDAPQQHHYHHEQHDQHHQPYQPHDQPHEYHHHEQSHYAQSQPGSSGQTFKHPTPIPSESFRSEERTYAEARKDQAPEHQTWTSRPPLPQPEHKPEPPKPEPAPSWDAQRQPPPPDSRPEAINFPSTHYEMSSDPAPFVPPERYPSPPKDMWYEVPKERPSQKPKSVFPWETHQPRPTRVFPREEPPVVSPMAEPTSAPSGERHASTDSQPQAEPSLTESSTAEQKSEPQTPTTPIVQGATAEPWSTFTLTNAWDDVPEIERYVDAIQKHRRTRSQGLRLGDLPAPDGVQTAWTRRGSKVTDFPSVDDRPSLPVTPAPMRRSKFWGGGGPKTGLDGEDGEQLPAAEGVPAQSEWVCVHGVRWSPADCLCDLTNVLRYYKDPVAQLQKLAKQQSEALLQKLGGSGSPGSEAMGTEGREIPSRPLPFGSEDVKSPTYVAQSSTVLSPKPVKPGSGSSSVPERLTAGIESAPRSTDSPVSIISAPSYQGPGPSFEKGEDIPTFETPAGPTEEEQDVLET
ncbi:hypothetical protein QBC46DRAFT_403741 [Diplogelasinospora grovesii]|uniref:glycogenin glucosyltransferase n=1 Tax=Diplogelasinospora grovesii TaxID=303347 RepID=A0AAN6S9H6_9PEZI|nr:hypothetical protein QBC46DRAFT_403741 [Diplogelasinospora grovesii]